MKTLQPINAPLTLLAASLALTLAAGCDGYGQPEDDTQLRASSADEIDDDQRLAEPPRPDAGDDWPTWAHGRAAEVAAARPELVEAIDPAQARPGRDGALRLRGAWMAETDAGPLLADAFANATEPGHRVILAEALAHTAGVPAAVLIDLATHDADAAVRAVVAPQLWRLRSDAGRDAIEVALADADARVRIGAVTSASRHPRAHDLVDALLPRLDDDSSEVRMVAARAVGSAGSSAQLADLEPLLDDADPQVRLVALRAAQRLDPAAAAKLAETHGLQEDADRGVARAAEQVDAAR